MQSIPLENVSHLFRNCLAAVNRQKEVTFHRFTAKQETKFGTDAFFRTRVRAATGVCLDVMTTSRIVRVGFRIVDRARPWVYFSCCINDKEVTSFGMDAYNEGWTELAITVPTADVANSRVTLYFPHCAEVVVTSVSIADGATITPVAPPARKMLALGDSITQGMDAHLPISSYPVALSRFFDMELLNQGVGGSVFNEKVLDEHLPFKPNVITLAYGTNDRVKCPSKKAFVANVNAYIQRLRALYKETPLIVITPLSRAGSESTTPVGTLKDVRRVIRESVSADENTIVIEGDTLTPNDPSLFSDGLHPTDAGFQHITHALTKELLAKNVLSLS